MTIRTRWLGLNFSRESIFGLYEEWKVWEREYLPPDSVRRGDLIVSVGARDGDDCWFYLEHGYLNLLLVEPNPKYWRDLEHNAKVLSHRYSAKIRIALKPFEMGDLEGASFVKFDCEGCESEVNLSKLGIPYVAELHEKVDPVKGIYPYVETRGYVRGG